MRDCTLAERNTRYAKAAGLHPIRIHDFRHSHVSLLANEGINIQEIARRPGHADVKLTWDTYSHLYPREEERAVKEELRALPRNPHGVKVFPESMR